MGRAGGFTGEYHAGPLNPGRGYVVNVPLTWHGAGTPAAVLRGAPAPARYALAALLVAVLAVFASQLRSRERALGRFAPLVPPHAIDRAWLDANVFHVLPEVVGAAWDDSTGAPEVAAVLARLVGEKKLSSSVTRSRRGIFGHDVLHLKLLVSRSAFNEYEGRLIDALFRSGEDETDTDAVRERYKKTGFDPAGKIRAPVEKLVHSMTRQKSGVPKPRARPTALLVLAAVVLLVLAVVTRPVDGIVVGAGSGIAIFLFVPAIIAASVWQKRVHGFVAGAAWFVVPMGVMIAGLLVMLLRATSEAGIFALAGLTALCLAMARSVLNQAASRESAETIAFRRTLAAARGYFVAQLAERQPRLEDAWFPYLLAFGLGPQMDRWFKAFGGVTSAGTMATMATASSMGSGSSSHGSGGWTGFGGGGGFAGGGASGSWAAAVGTMAAGVASPGSSGSGGGGGGGGSSGGGGGGGW